MNERLKELAERAGLITRQDIDENNQEYFDDLECFAELVRQDEREACAVLCLELTQAKASGESYEDGTIDCAKTIRARSEQ